MSALYESVSQIISEVRKAKTEANTTQKTPVKKIEIKAPESLISILKDNGTDLENVTNAYPDSVVYQEASEFYVNEITLDMNFISLSTRT